MHHVDGVVSPPPWWGSTGPGVVLHTCVSVDHSLRPVVPLTVVVGLTGFCCQMTAHAGWTGRARLLQDRRLRICKGLRQYPP